MDKYEWKKNKAIVDRLYYSERCFQLSAGFAAIGTTIDMMFISQNYFAERAKRRIPKYWIAVAGFNAFTMFMLLRPLTKEEISVQWKKRKLMGKWLYSLFHLEE